MTKQLINNALNKILYKGQYAKKDSWSYNKETPKCEDCGKVLEEGESKWCERCEKNPHHNRKERSEW